MARRLPKHVSAEVQEPIPSAHASGDLIREHPVQAAETPVRDKAEEVSALRAGPDVVKIFADPQFERRSIRDWEDEARRHPTLLIRKTLRSGQNVRYYGNVVILGDVNPGAEIRAGGDIIVMGWLRGMAHAGADGNDQAMVAAFRLNPTQIRIAHFIGRSPDAEDATLPAFPEFAEVRDGQLIIEQWQHSMLGNIR
ncbi:septum site-determining protein MinC [Sulfobacillus sp. hq2]|uniref:septum site-determining protein MinC n=1 Tax=Sulfobacillus TaxID=28033 RepID=UPI001FA93A7C|nr:septum site-determining protein MinC [Sulfobacillus sp. hq2]